MTSDIATASGMDVARAPRPGMLVAIALGAGAAAGTSLVLVLTSDDASSSTQGVLYVWIILTFTTAGLVAWWRRPQSRFGPLMALTGLVTFLATLSFADNRALSTVGQLLDVVLVALVLHVLLAFPTGQLEGRFERVLVTATYLTAVGFQLVRMAIGDPDNLLAVTDAPELAQAAYRLQYCLLAALAVTGIVLIVVRRRADQHALRRPLALLVYAFTFALAMTALLLFVAVLGKHGFETARLATLFAIGLAPAAFLLGLLDARLTRSAVADLFVDLRTHPAPADLRDALARALRDPSLELVYWLAEFDSWADVEGRLVTLPAPSQRATTTIDRDGKHIAALLHDPALNDEPELLAAVGAAAGIALENAQLQAELKAHLDELQRSRSRVIEAGQAERKRLERNLHDGAQQRLIALSLELARLERRLSSDSDTVARLHHARKEIGATLAELRDVAHGLHPAVLTGHGLAVALESIAARATVPVTLAIELDDRLPEPVEVAAYYVVSESLANVGKHARASAVTIHVSRNVTGVVVEIVDDGIGGADTREGSGLRGLADRVEALGGRLQVFAPAGGGTAVRAELPCE